MSEDEDNSEVTNQLDEPIRPQTLEQREAVLVAGLLAGLERLVKNNVVQCRLEGDSYLLAHNGSNARLELAGATPKRLLLNAAGRVAIIENSAKLTPLLRSVQEQITRWQTREENFANLEAVRLALGIKVPAEF